MKNIFLIILLFVCVPSKIFGEEIITDTTQEHSPVTQETAQEETISDLAVSAEEITEKTAQSESDSLLSTESNPQHMRIAVIRRDHDYKRQAWMAAVMMTFVAVILGTSQSWNPR